MCFGVCVIAPMIGLVLRLVTDASSCVGTLSLPTYPMDTNSMAGSTSSYSPTSKPSKFQTPREKLAAERHARQLGEQIGFERLPLEPDEMSDDGTIDRDIIFDDESVVAQEIETHKSDHDRDTTLYEDGFEVAQQSARFCEEETDRPPVSATDSDVKLDPTTEVSWWRSKLGYWGAFLEILETVFLK
eukprot:FR737824.1.p1 GENE.FR737824.1~~FR737824.1.p1  ORF type:complete len:187 (+),score=9.74 FR737824.1:360-920(+)